MKNLRISILDGAVCALMLAVSLSAADKPTTTPAKAAAGNSNPAIHTWPAETMPGRIANVKSAEKIVVVRGPGVPFDMLVTPKTQITFGGQTIALKDLVHYKNKEVSVKFTPERRGDVAESIRIVG